MSTLRHAPILLALFLLALPAGAAAQAAAEPELVTRSFEIRYKPFEDAVLVVMEIAARDGTEHNDITLQRSLKRITVTDVREVVQAVAQALSTFDVPPRQVTVRLTLFLASRDDPDPEDVDRVEDVYNSVASMLRRTLQYTDYELVGSTQVASVEGHPRPTFVTFDSGYSVEFLVTRVDPTRRLIQLDPLVLSRLAGDGSGDWDQIQATALNLTAGHQMIQAVSSGPESERALILAIEANTID